MAAAAAQPPGLSAFAGRCAPCSRVLKLNSNGDLLLEYSASGAGLCAALRAVGGNMHRSGRLSGARCLVAVEPRVQPAFGTNAVASAASLILDAPLCWRAPPSLPRSAPAWHSLPASRCEMLPLLALS